MKKLFHPCFTFLFVLLPFRSLHAQAPVLTQAMREYTWQYTGHHPLPEHDPATVLAQKIKSISTVHKNKFVITETILAAYQYDQLGRITEVYSNKYGNLQKVVFTYDEMGLVLQKAIYKGREMTTKYDWTYDEKGRVLQLATTEFRDGFNPHGRPHPPREAETKAQTFVYHDQDLRVQIKRSPEEEIITYQFDQEGKYCESTYENKAQQIKRSQKESPCRRFSYRDFEPINQNFPGLLPVPKTYKAIDTVVSTETGKKRSTITYAFAFRPDTSIAKIVGSWYSMKQTRLVRTLDEKGQCTQYLSEAYADDTLLLSRHTEQYNEEGRIIEMRSFESQHSDFSIMDATTYDQPPMPVDRYTHYVYTYYPSGILRSKCAMDKNGKEIWCEETVVEYY